jgi:phosphorylcholine metabolism protein LicD
MEWNNYKKIDAGCNIYGKQRLEIAVYLRDYILNKYNYFIENGTLLGAFRNCKFIDHDDDFDFALLLNNKNEIKDVFNYIKDNLKSKYCCRLIDSYCDKIEIYNPIYGKYNLQGPDYNNKDYHYVTIDLQFYVKEANYYRQLYYLKPKQLFDKNLFFPFNTILLENEKFNCPKNTEEFLKINYGSINETAKYNSNTGKYE